MQAHWTPYFNSHPHKEDDDFRFKVNAESLDISTHILTRRMTAPKFKSAASNAISTHILTRRMTGGSLYKKYRRNISTHILTRRMTNS